MTLRILYNLVAHISFHHIDVPLNPFYKVKKFQYLYYIV